MSYDPVPRGPFPAGVRTLEVGPLAPPGRALVTELWYPATPDFSGQDVAGPTVDRFSIASGIPGLRAARQQAGRDATPAPRGGPLVVFSHGFASHRRQSTFLCSHLASHGYVVAAPDHAGGTLAELLGPWLAMARAARAERPETAPGALRAA